MPLKVGDTVRTEAGTLGTIAGVNEAGVMAHVELRNNGRVIGIGLYPVARLTKIQDAK